MTEEKIPLNERDRLIEYLECNCTDQYGELCTWMVVDFIINDRRRIVAPLVSDDLNKYSKENLIHLIQVTLHLAGLDKEKV